MSNDKKQTALSFFLMGLIDLEIGKGISTDKVIELHYLFDQAKAMEKEQIVNAVDGFPLDKRNLNGQDYYNETYGGEK
jgi:hypothetical protein